MASSPGYWLQFRVSHMSRCIVRMNRQTTLDLRARSLRLLQPERLNARYRFERDDFYIWYRELVT